MTTVRRKYKVEVYRLGWITYRWEVRDVFAMSTMALGYGHTMTMAGARRAGEKWVYARYPVLVKEVS